MINADSLLESIRNGKIKFADLSEEQLRYFYQLLHWIVQMKCMSIM